MRNRAPAGSVQQVMATRHGTALVLLMAVTLVAAGCGDAATTAGPAPDIVASPTPPQGTATPGTAAPPTGLPQTVPPQTVRAPTATPRTIAPPVTGPALPPGTPRPPVKETTVVGDVVEGVEAGCYVLRVAGGKELLLIGGNIQRLRAAGRVRVTGRAEPGLATTCQQGVPFIVSDVSPA